MNHMYENSYENLKILSSLEIPSEMLLGYVHQMEDHRNLSCFSSDESREAFFQQFEGGVSGCASVLFWIAVRGNKLVGLLGMRGENRQAVLDWFSVFGEVKRDEIGELLLKDAHSFCKFHGYTEMLLTIPSENGELKKLCSGMGFSRKGGENHGLRECYFRPINQLGVNYAMMI